MAAKGVCSWGLFACQRLSMFRSYFQVPWPSSEMPLRLPALFCLFREKKMEPDATSFFWNGRIPGLFRLPFFRLFFQLPGSFDSSDPSIPRILRLLRSYDSSDPSTPGSCDSSALSTPRILRLLGSCDSSALASPRFSDPGLLRLPDSFDSWILSAQPFWELSARSSSRNAVSQPTSVGKYEF